MTNFFNAKEEKYRAVQEFNNPCHISSNQKHELEEYDEDKPCAILMCKHCGKWVYVN